jgi:hypothetical protein
MFLMHWHFSPKAQLETSIPKILIEDLRSFPLPAMLVESIGTIEFGERDTRQVAELTNGCLSEAGSFTDRESLQLVAASVQRIIYLLGEKRDHESRFESDAARLLQIVPEDESDVFGAFAGRSVFGDYASDHIVNSPETTFASVADVIRRNQRHCRNVSDMDTVLSSIRDVFEAMMSDVRQVQRKLSSLDALIDGLVYHLYRLDDRHVAQLQGN